MDTAMLGDATALGALMIAAGGFGLRQAMRMRARVSQVGTLASTGPGQAIPGMARIRGRLRIQDPLTSPFSRTPCCWYHVEVEKSADDGTSAGSGWRPIHEESSQSEFFIEDESGSLAVRPQGLVANLPWNFDQEVIAAPTAAQRHLVDYVAENVPKKLNSWVFKTTWNVLASSKNAGGPAPQERIQALRRKHKTALHEETRGQPYRFREVHLRAGQVCEIAGTLDMKATDRVLTRGSPGSPFLIATNLGDGWGTEQRRRARRFGAWSLGSMVMGVLILVFG